jgi:MFS family permease
MVAVLSARQQIWRRAALYSVLVMMGADMFLVPMLIPAIAQALDMSIAQAAYVVAAFGAAYAVLSPLLSGLLRYRSGRAVIGAGLLIVVCACVSATLSTNLTTLMLARAGSGVGAAIVNPTVWSTLQTTAPPDGQARVMLSVSDVWSMACSEVTASTATSCPSARFGPNRFVCTAFRQGRSSFRWQDPIQLSRSAAVLVVLPRGPAPLLAQSSKSRQWRRAQSANDSSASPHDLARSRSTRYPSALAHCWLSVTPGELPAAIAASGESEWTVTVRPVTFEINKATSPIVRESAARSISW